MDAEKNEIIHHYNKLTAVSNRSQKVEFKREKACYVVVPVDKELVAVASHRHSLFRRGVPCEYPKADLP